ncbi:MAG: diacylglycerol kinase family protein [Bdellovibrionota bacterium]
MHQVRVFLNKRASGGDDALKMIATLEKRLFRSHLEILSPNSLEDLKFELDRAVRENVDIVVSVGGDGTVNTLIQHLGDSNTAFLIVPTGTANDLAREMGVLGRLDKAVQKIRSAEPERIDLIRINDKLMATNGGLGLSSQVAARVNDLRKQMPFFKDVMHLMHDRIYSAMLGFELFGRTLRYYDFEIESQEFSGRVHSPLLMINNQPALGGKFRIAPETHNDDGRFNVSIFTHKTRMDFTKALMKIRFKGGPDANDPHLISFETSRVHVKSYQPILFYGDGETLEFAKDFEISCRPKALKVYGYRKIRELADKGILL